MCLAGWEVASIDEKKFVLDSGGTVCEWYLNDELQDSSFDDRGLDIQDSIDYLVDSVINKKLGQPPGSQ